jgi:poly-gamma-glutamate capsule biosynthesis protein CapA/YwtB (metallophosphatase superfamily)
MALLRRVALIAPTLGFVPLTAWGEELPASGQTPQPFLKAACQQPVRINFFGDIFVDEARFRDTPFQEITAQLNWADFNVANFEGTVTNRKNRAFPDFPFALLMSNKVPALLARHRIGHVTRANNHSMDYGVNGLADTSRALAKAGIAFTGAGQSIVDATKPLSLSTANGSVAVLSFATTFPEESWAGSDTGGIAYPTQERLKQAIESAKKSHDFVVTVFHWGGELTTQIRGYQQELAKNSVELGASLVVGHHAHMAQGFQTISGVPVAFGLGNFLFTSTNIRNTLSLMLHAQFCRERDGEKRQISVDFTPIETGTLASQFSVNPAGLTRFQKLVQTFKRGSVFPETMSFYLPTEKRSATLAEWMTTKPSAP